MVKKINLLCLIAAIITVLVLPMRKEIWYDESISILCSKGISSDTHLQYAKTAIVSAETITQQNTLDNVYKATVLDNGNSLVYNVLLHWFTMAAGNDITAYMLLSKLCAIAALLAFFVLCRQFMKDSIFTSVAILLLVTDLNFYGMSHEIRAYEMGTFFITIAGVFFYKYLYENEKPVYVFWIGLFSVAAVLSHYLSLYVILVFLGYMLAVKKARLFSVKNIIAMAVPVLLIGVYFYYSYVGLKYMNAQNTAITHRAELKGPFTIMHVLLTSMEMGAVDFKIVLSSFRGNNVVILLSVALVAGLYIAALKSTTNTIEKRNLNLLLILGISGTLMLALLSIKAHHYTPLYKRYHSFCIPFASLFAAYALYVLWGNPKVNKIVKAGALAVVLLPCCALFAMLLRSAPPAMNYNHPGLAYEIAKKHITRVAVPEWDDAFLIQAFMPEGGRLEYVISETPGYFILYTKNGMEQAPALKNIH